MVSSKAISFLLCHWLIHGPPPRRSYHDRQWAAKMKEIGLQPVTIGEPGGKETGQSVTCYILPGGPDAKACAKPKAKRFRLPWQSAPAGQQSKAKKASVLHQNRIRGFQEGSLKCGSRRIPAQSQIIVEGGAEDPAETPGRH
jgi:hypothetical protein